MDTEDLIKQAYTLTLSMGLRDGPRNVEDQLAIAQTNALIAIAQELKRANDANEEQLAYEERLADMRATRDLYSQ